MNRSQYCAPSGWLANKRKVMITLYVRWQLLTMTVEPTVTQLIISSISYIFVCIRDLSKYMQKVYIIGF